VGVRFYDRRNDPGTNLNIDVYLAISTNHGKTFHANQRITTASFPPAVNFDPAIAFNYMGDYNQMVASGEKFYLAWGDNRRHGGRSSRPDRPLWCLSRRRLGELYNGYIPQRAPSNGRRPAAPLKRRAETKRQ
jgi:hypothetical protein